MKSFASVLVALSVIFVFSGNVQADLDDGLIAYYPFEDSAVNAVDGKAGSVFGSPAYGPGIVGKAIRLDGIEDYIKGDPLPIEQIRNSMTISVWAKRMQDDANYVGVLVSQVSQYQRAPFGLYFSPTNDTSGDINSFAWYLSGDGTNTELGWGNTPSTFSKRDHWYHVVATFDGANQKAEIYVNGVKQTVDWHNSVIPQMLLHETGDLVIGSWEYQGGSNPYADRWPFGGELDELRIYDRILTESEINELAGTTLETGLVAYYPFNGSLDDMSGNGNHGVAHGAVPTTDRFNNDNGAYKFDGVDNYIELPGDGLDDLMSDEGTITAWVKFTNLEKNNSIFCLGRSGSAYNYIVFNASDYQLLPGVRLGSTSDQYYLKSDAVIIPGQYHHVAWVKKSGGSSDNAYNSHLYIDGVKRPVEVHIGTADKGHYFSDVVNQTDVMTIGAMRRHVMQNNFEGEIDEVRIYNRALSESELVSLVNQDQTFLSVDIENVPEATWALTGIWRVDVYKETGEPILQQFGKGVAKVVIPGLKLGSQFNYKVYYQHDDEQAVWEYWGVKEVTILNSEQLDTFVRVKPWCSDISASVNKMVQGDDFKATMTVQNDSAAWARVRVEGRWGGGQVFSSVEQRMAPWEEKTFTVNLSDVDYSPNQTFYYWVNSTGSLDSEEGWEVTDHGFHEGFIQMESLSSIGSWALIYGFEDTNNNIWQIGVPKGISMDPWNPGDTVPYVSFFKNGKEDFPNAGELQKLFEAVSRALDGGYPNLNLGYAFNPAIGVWQTNCGFSTICELSLLGWNDNHRKDLYVNLIWEAITSRQHPFLLREFYIAESDTSPGCFASSPTPGFLRSIDDLILRFGDAGKFSGHATDYVGKILELKTLSETEPALRDEVTDNTLLSSVTRILGAGDIVLTSGLELVQYTTLMEYMAVSGRAEDRLETLVQAYNYANENHDGGIDQKLGDALIQVSEELTEQIQRLEEDITDVFFKDVLPDVLANSDWVQKQLGDLIKFGGSHLFKTFGHLSGHKLALANMKLNDAFRIALASHALLIEPGKEWCRIHLACTLSKMLTYFAQNSDQYWSGYFDDRFLLTKTAIEKHQIRDVFDLLTSFQMEYLDRGLQMVDSDWLGVVSDGLVGTIETAKSPQLFWLHYASTSLLLGKEIGNSIRNWTFSDELQAIFDERAFFENHAELKNAAMNQWAELLESYALKDSDGDGLIDGRESLSCSNMDDADSDDDGITDGNEDKNKNGRFDVGETDPCDPDTDADGIYDGTEIGLTAPQIEFATDISKGVFIADEDPKTSTDPVNPDTDGDGVSDGVEDSNKNGKVDEGETDPDSRQGIFLPYVPLLLLDS